MKKDNSNRVYRGGCCIYDARYARVDCRNRYYPSYCNDYLGFRFFRTVNPLEQLSEVIHGSEQ